MSDTTIAAVLGRRVWDSRGRPTVEAEITLAGGAFGRAIAPAGASRGRHEAIDLRDGGTRHGGLGVDRAVANVNGEIARRLRGMDARDQEAIDLAYLYAGEGRRLFGETAPSELPDKAAMSVRAPVGVAAIISPWNVPFS